MSNNQRKRWNARWNRYACGPRCIQEILRRSNKPVPAARTIYNQFVRRFLKPDTLKRKWRKEPGATLEHEIKSVAIEFGAGTRVIKPATIADLLSAMANHDLVAILGLAYLMPLKAGGFTQHIMILEPNAANIAIWTPYGRSNLGGYLPIEKWDVFQRWKMEVLVILR